MSLVNLDRQFKRLMGTLVLVEWEGAKRTEHTRGTLLAASKETVTLKSQSGVYHYIQRLRVLEVMPTEGT